MSGYIHTLMATCTLPKEKEAYDAMKIMCLVADRKKLVAAIEEATGVKLKYQGPPSFAFAAGDFTVERDGTLCVENENDNRDILLSLVNQKLIDDSWNEDREVLCISIPADLHSGASATRLVQLLWTKQEVINKSIKCQKGFVINERFIEALSEEPPQSYDEFLFLLEKCGGGNAVRGVEFAADKISFTGFPYTKDSDYLKAFTELAGFMSQMAINMNRVELKKAELSNEKYYFRIWLVRLGFEGDKYKTSRKILLQNLSGHSAFRTDEQKELHKAKYQRRSSNE